ncbi:unnamed protein product [Spirodela intermedia]|uniref:Uncharacterized protein n=1 Tax=Spirodela intermedia TaxID=51605 RepID=A0A7I8JXB8_SPIIN|nr:unnamed protein product [Spirodela intermedia]
MPTSTINPPSQFREEPRVGARVARTDRGTCASLPFHIIGGQPTVGQGVVIHAW